MLDKIRAKRTEVETQIDNHQAEIDRLTDKLAVYDEIIEELEEDEELDEDDAEADEEPTSRIIVTPI